MVGYRTKQTSSNGDNPSPKFQTKCKMTRTKTSYHASIRCNHSSLLPALAPHTLHLTWIRWTMWTRQMYSTLTISPTTTTLTSRELTPTSVFIILSLIVQTRAMTNSSSRTVIRVWVAWRRCNSSRWPCSRTWWEVEWMHWSHCKTSRHSLAQQAPRICCCQALDWAVPTLETWTAPASPRSWSQPCHRRTMVASSTQLVLSTSSSTRML